MRVLECHLSRFSILFFVVFLWGCQNPQKDETENEVIEIGAILPLSGNLAQIGTPKQQAMEIAIEEFNSDNIDPTIKINYEDSKGNPKDGVAALQKLISTTNIKYYYVDLTTIVNSCAPIVDKNKVLTFAGSAQPEVTDLSIWLFRVFAGGEQEIEMMVSHLLNNDHQSIYVLHTNELYGNNAYKYLKNKFESKGGRILGVDEYSLGTNDFKELLIKAKGLNPDKIVLLGYGIAYATVLKQSRELDIPKKKLFLNLGATNSNVLQLDTALVDGIEFVGPRFSYLLENNMLEPEMQKFVDKYKSKYNSVPDFRAAYTYDVVKILNDLWMKSEDDSPSSINSKILSIKDYDGASGKISFHRNGDSNTDLVLAQFYQGKMKLLENEE